ncbi:site-specific integrase [Helcococcus kunzii]|uniref:site-specific integrase n=1 Tax=Helcococcus kunzii TaxID=40091 RepID=UPI0038ACE6BB
MANINGISYFLYRTESKKINWRYEIRYKETNNQLKRITKQGFESKKEANNAAIEVINSLVIREDVETNITTVSELFDTYINNLIISGRSDKTIQIRSQSKTFYKNLLHLDITKLRKIDLQNLINKSSHLESSTIKTYLIAIKGVCELAIDMHLIKDNPTAKLKIFENVKKKNKKKKKDRIILSPERIKELYLFLKPFNIELALMMLIQGTCGLRFGEVFSLRYIDVKNGSLRIEVQDIDESLKTVNSYRIVPVPEYTLNEIKVFMKKGLNISGKLFNHYKRDSAIGTINRKLKEFIPGLSTHDLRHSYGSNLIVEGVDLPTIAKLMGDTLETIIDTYIHSTDEGMNKAKDAIKSLNL